MAPSHCRSTVVLQENVLIHHTAELDDATLTAARSLCDATFGDDFTDANWEHALGGIHALHFEGDRLVAHGALVARRLLHDGRSLRTGYVKALAVASDRQRRGYGAAVMAVLHRYVDRAYVLGALASSDVRASLYLALGWTRWTGPRPVLAPDGIRPTPAVADVFVRPVSARLDSALPLVCDWREGHAW